MSILDDLKGTPVTPTPDYPISCECGWSGHVSDCDTYEDSDGWEMPTYTVPICPTCQEDLEI